MNDNINTPRLHSRQSDRETPRRNNQSRGKSNNNRNRRGGRNFQSKRKFSTFKIGQIFSVIYNLALLYLIFTLVQMGKDNLAIKLFAINAGLIVFGILVTIFEKKIFTNRQRSNNRKGRN